MILDLITLKYNLGLFILFFETMNPGLHYVPEKSILIKHGYLDWRGTSLRSLFFVTNKVVISVLQPKNILVNYSLVQDECWIFKCMIGQLKKKKMKKKDEKCDSRAKTRKGGLEQRWEELEGPWARRIKEWRVNNQEAPGAAMRSSTLSKTKKFEPSAQECLFQFSRDYHGRSWYLIKSSYSGTKNELFF